MSSPVLQNEIDWQAYWAKADAGRPSFYSSVASFYRRFLIGRQLRHFVKKYFRSSAPVLHAGCGSGQVDQSIQDLISPISFDLSPTALAYNRKTTGSDKPLCCGSVFELPFQSRSLSGIYNLGVMEHFSEEEILRTFAEFNRCLEDSGVLLIFWPPVYGLSVKFLDGLHFVMRNVFRTKKKLHPEEISRLRSREHAENLLHRAGFQLVEYSFGPMDFFTQAVLAAKKA